MGDVTSVDSSKVKENKPVRKKAKTVIQPGAPWNEIEEAFLKRRSVRKYKRAQVPEHYIRRILEVGRYSPSQGNCQPWRFVVVRDRNMIDEMEVYVRDQMDQLVQAALQEGSSEVSLMSGNDAGPLDLSSPAGLHPAPLGLLADAPPGEGIKVFHGAPTLIFPLMDTRGIGHLEIDLGIVGTNIIMAAYSLGLGTCWVGFAEMLNAGDWPRRLGVEEPYKLVEAICIGFEAGDAQANFIRRETHKITWFEGGDKREMY